MKDTSQRIFTAHLNVDETGFAAGKTLAELNEKVGGNLRVVQIVRGAAPCGGGGVDAAGGGRGYSPEGWRCVAGAGKP